MYCFNKITITDITVGSDFQHIWWTNYKFVALAIYSIIDTALLKASKSLLN